jgi:hypothetical protein
MKVTANRNQFKWMGLVLVVCLMLAGRAVAQKRREIVYDFRSAAALVASLENHNGQYLLSLTNNTEKELRGQARLSLGAEASQSEIGQLAIAVPANETKLYLLKGLSAQGEHYTLRIFDGNAALLFYKIATVRRVSDGILTQAETVSLSAETVKTAAKTADLPATAIPAVTQPVNGADYQIKLRIAAGAEPDDPFNIVFELAGQRSLFDATLNLSLGPARMSKPVSINRQAVVEFNVPGELGDGKIQYTLLRKDGTVAAQGDTTLDKLFADDVVTASDIRSDKVAYVPGETAQLTFVLEGASKDGFRLEITANDAQDNQFFATTIYGKGGESAGEHPLSLTLPTDAKERVVVKYKLFDAANNTLFDSGERELAISEKS